MVGAFLSGAVPEAKWFDLERVDAFREVILLAVMPVYFLSTGLRTFWEMGGPATATAALALMAVAGTMLTKPIVALRVQGVVA